MKENYNIHINKIIEIKPYMKNEKRGQIFNTVSKSYITSIKWKGKVMSNKATSKKKKNTTFNWK